jgi:hypothetical protein
MQLKYLITPLAILLISILVSASIIQAYTQILTENRKSAIVKALTQSQFRNFAEYNARIIMIFDSLDALEEIDLEEAVSKIVSQQNTTAGNVTLWGWPRMWGITYVVKPDAIYTCLMALNLIGALDHVNKKVLINIALSRYNESDGAFHEPIIQVEWSNGRVENHTIGGLELDFYAMSDLAYAESNIVSTFIWASILAQLDALDKINATKTTEWVLSCIAENGAFGPFPNSYPDSLPPWSSLRANPFYVDRYGTGIAYTYAAISTLKILGHLEDNNVIDKEKIKEYVLSCQEVTSRDYTYFKAHPDDNRWTVGVMRQYTYYAVKTLEHIGMLEESDSVIQKVINFYIKEYQNLQYEDSWPLPNRLWNATWGNTTWADVYGLFGGSFLPVHSTYYAVLALNSTKSLNLLNQLTPASLKAWSNLIILSILVCGVSIACILTYKGRELLKEGKKRCKEQPPQQLHNDSDC